MKPVPSVIQSVVCRVVDLKLLRKSVKYDE